MSGSLPRRCSPHHTNILCGAVAGRLDWFQGQSVCVALQCTFSVPCIMLIAIGPALEACGSHAVAYLNLHTYTPLTKAQERVQKRHDMCCRWSEPRTESLDAGTTTCCPFYFIIVSRVSAVMPAFW